MTTADDAVVWRPPQQRLRRALRYSGCAAKQKDAEAMPGTLQVVRHEVGTVQVFRKALPEQEPAGDVDTHAVVEDDRFAQGRPCAVIRDSVVERMGIGEYHHCGLAGAYARVEQL